MAVICATLTLIWVNNTDATPAVVNSILLIDVVNTIISPTTQNTADEGPGLRVGGGRGQFTPFRHVVARIIMTDSELVGSCHRLYSSVGLGVKAVVGTFRRHACVMVDSSS